MKVLGYIRLGRDCKNRPLDLLKHVVEQEGRQRAGSPRHAQDGQLSTGCRAGPRHKRPTVKTGKQARINDSERHGAIPANKSKRLYLSGRIRL